MINFDDVVVVIWFNFTHMLNSKFDLCFDDMFRWRHCRNLIQFCTHVKLKVWFTLWWCVLMMLLSQFDSILHMHQTQSLICTLMMCFDDVCALMVCFDDVVIAIWFNFACALNSKFDSHFDDVFWWHCYCDLIQFCVCVKLKVWFMLWWCVLMQNVLMISQNQWKWT